MSQSIARAAALLSFFAIGSVAVGGAFAKEPARTAPPAEHVDGRYHSIVNGIADYDGFDRFRHANGKPLPGWEQVLRSPG